MRTGTFTYNGKDYLVCMSLLVTTRLEDAHIKLEQLETSDAPVGTVLRVLSFMIEAGDRYAKMNGIENPGVVSFEDLSIGLDLTDLTGITQLIAECVRGERRVNADPPKKAVAPGA